VANAGLTLEFTLERDTKNTVRYAEVPADPKAPEELAIGSLYVQKRTARELGGGDFPRRLKVTVES
jgi:hypothetical protein